MTYHEYEDYYRCKIQFDKIEEADTGNWTCALDYYDGYECYGCDWKEKILSIRVDQVRNGKTNTSEITGKALANHITTYAVTASPICFHEISHRHGDTSGCSLGSDDITIDVPFQ